MQGDGMRLKVLVPHEVFVEREDVTGIVVETSGGAYGLLPRRLDCVAAVVPGILTYETAGGDEVFLAVDEGVLVKTGPEVRVSVRNAIGGADLGRLRAAVEERFVALGEREKSVRSALAKLESGLARRLTEVHREG